MYIYTKEENYCPACGTPIDAATSIDPNVETDLPQEGDLSICFECTAFLTYDADLKSVVLTSEQLLDLPNTLMLDLIATRSNINKLKKDYNEQDDNMA